MTTDAQTENVHEVVATFFDAPKLEKAVSDLIEAGFPEAQISMVAGEHTVGNTLGAHYRKAEEEHQEPGAPKTAFVAKESVGDAVHGLFGGFFFTGASVAAGAVVATAGALGSPIIAGLAAAAAVGGVGAVALNQIGKSEAEYLQEEIDRGHLLLFVRILDRNQEATATEIVQRHSGFEPHVIKVPRDDTD